MVWRAVLSLFSPFVWCADVRRQVRQWVAARPESHHRVMRKRILDDTTYKRSTAVLDRAFCDLVNVRIVTDLQSRNQLFYM